MIEVTLPDLSGAQGESWEALMRVAPLLGNSWILVGGQLVLLHQVERGFGNIRPTADIDLVVDIRVDLNGLASTHQTLTECGFDQDPPNCMGVAHRYSKRGATIDVLAPERLGPRADLTLGAGNTIEAPGTRQAFSRRESVAVEFRGLTVEIHRPNLVGALFGKAAAFTKIASQSQASKAKHLGDFESLAHLLNPDDRSLAKLTKSERKTISKVVSSRDIGSTALRSIELLLEASA